jgi:hypothetical protein
MRGVLFDLSGCSIVGENDAAIVDLVSCCDDIGNGDLPELVVSQSLEICTAEGKVADVLDDMRKDLLLGPAEGRRGEGGCISRSC